MLNADNGSYDLVLGSSAGHMPEPRNPPEVSYIKHFVNIPAVCGKNERTGHSRMGY